MARQLERLKVPREAYDGIVSSGDVTRGVIEARPRPERIPYRPGARPPMFDGLDVQFAPLERADYVVCSGLFDETRSRRRRTIARGSTACSRAGCS